MKRTTGTWHRFSQRILLLATLLIPFAPAGAFIDPPTFSPMQPYAGQPIDMTVRGGGCHGIVVPPPGIPLLEVQTNGNTIDAIVTGVEVYDPLACIFGIGTVTLNIGELPEGSYTVRIRIRRTYPRRAPE